MKDVEVHDIAAGDVHVPTTGELVHELMEGLTHSGSRWWRTLKYLWFNPGKLTQEFLAGRRIASLCIARYAIVFGLSVGCVFIFAFLQL